MNIVTGWPVEDQQTGVYIIESLVSMGHTVYNVDPKRVHREALQSGTPVEELLTRQMEHAINANNPDFLFLSRQGWFTTIAERYNGQIPVVSWNVDVRYNPEGEWKSLHPFMKACSHWMTIAGGNIMWYRENINPNTHWLSEGCYPPVHRRPTQEEIKKAGSAYRLEMYTVQPVAFAGSVSDHWPGPPNRMDLLRAINDVQPIRLWGDNTEYLVNEDHSLMAFCSKINLGHSGWPQVACSQSARDYRIMGAGGFLLTNHVRFYEKIFESGKHCVFYDGIDDCLEKIEYYCDPKNEDERTNIRAAGLDIVHKYHTFVNRLDRMISIVGGKKDSMETYYPEWAMSAPITGLTVQ
jgi:hypothetical protein